MSKVKMSLGGVAVVCCVHDREKRQIVSERHVAELGALVGVTYDPKQHKLAHCPCCDNMFVQFDDEPKLCHACRQPNVHALGGPLPEPTGVMT